MKAELIDISNTTNFTLGKIYDVQEIKGPRQIIPAEGYYVTNDVGERTQLLSCRFRVLRETPVVPMKMMYEQSHTPGGISCLDVNIGPWHLGRIFVENGRIKFKGRQFIDGKFHEAETWFSSFTEFENSWKL
jgi:hypothetical protein